MSSTVSVAVLPPTVSWTAAGIYFTQVPVDIDADRLWAVVGAADLSGVTLSINGSTPGDGGGGGGDGGGGDGGLTLDELTVFVDDRIDLKLVGN